MDSQRLYKNLGTAKALAPDPQVDQWTGTLTGKTFTIAHRYLTFPIAGGYHPYQTADNYMPLPWKDPASNIPGDVKSIRVTEPIDPDKVLLMVGRNNKPLEVLVITQKNGDIGDIRYSIPVLLQGMKSGYSCQWAFIGNRGSKGQWYFRRSSIDPIERTAWSEFFTPGYAAFKVGKVSQEGNPVKIETERKHTSRKHF